MDAVRTASVRKVDSSTSNVTLAASYKWRRSMSIFNSDDNALFVKFGATATSTDFTVKIPAGGHWEMPQPPYTGQIDGIWADDEDDYGSAHITEL